MNKQLNHERQTAGGEGKVHDITNLLRKRGRVSYGLCSWERAPGNAGNSV